jgi:hypothetical protein
MFGQNQDDSQVVVEPPQDLTNATPAPSNGVVLPEPDDANVIKPDTASTPEPAPEPQVQSAPTVPQDKDDDLVIPEDVEEEDIAPAITPKPVEPSVTVEEDEPMKNSPSFAPTDDHQDKVSDFVTTATDDLSDLKRKALEALSPLVDELDQTPEEKFGTTMMLVQATNNKDLLSTAYEVAQTITDDKEKAQALLDVVNEINYFSQAKN